MNTTISISTDIRDQIKEFGNKGETYEDVIVKLLESAKKRQLHDLLMDETNCITVAEARRRLNK